MRERPDLRTALRYAALQVPGIALFSVAALAASKWFDAPGRFVWACIALWVVKDIAMFPFVWRAYATGLRGGLHDLRDRCGTADEVLNPRGWVTLGHERWRARCADTGAPIPAGARVRVVAVHNLEVQVTRLDGATPERGAESTAAQTPQP